MPHPNSKHAKAYRERKLAKGICLQCTRPLDFTRSSRLCPTCSDISAAWKRAYRARHPRATCRVCGKPVGRYRRAYCQDHSKDVDPEYQVEKRIKQRRQRYNLSSSEYASLMDVKGCEICGSAGAQLFIDHDHTTGKARGMLCTGCNSLLGSIERRPLSGKEWIQNAIRYIEQRAS